MRKSENDLRIVLHTLHVILYSPSSFQRISFQIISTVSSVCEQFSVAFSHSVSISRVPFKRIIKIPSSTTTTTTDELDGWQRVQLFYRAQELYSAQTTECETYLHLQPQPPTLLTPLRAFVCLKNSHIVSRSFRDLS